MDNDAEIARLTAALESRDEGMKAIGGCGDGDCVVVKPVGMHTNGGCRCMRDLVKSQRFAYISNKFAREVREALAALRSSAPAEGDYVRVPREPTREMVAAAFEARDHVGNALSRAAEGGFSSGVMCVYAAMIAAAPTPSGGERHG